MDYYSNPAISASGLKLIDKSPAHYYASLVEKSEPTPAMEFGTAAHCAMLEPEEFDNRYTVIPEGLSLATKEGKAVRDGIIATGKKPLKYDDMQRILKMQASVQAHPFMQTLSGAQYEKEHYFYINGVSAKMKPDLMIEPCKRYPVGMIIDLKTTTSATMNDFARQVFNQKMYIQAAFYTDAFQRIYNSVPDFFWLVVESKPPHLVSVFSPPPHLLEFGRSEYLRLLDIYNECMNTGVWEGYGTSITELVLPSWAENIIAGGGDVEIEFIDEEENV